MSSTIISDTTLWLYLGRVQQYNLLTAIYEMVLVTESVCLELDAGRMTRPDTVDPRQLAWVKVVKTNPDDIANLPQNELGMGELSVIAYARRHQIDVVGLDDLEARTFAQALGLKVVGTPGILLRAKHLGYLDAVRPVLEAIKESGFYLSQPLFNHVLLLAGE